MVSMPASILMQLLDENSAPKAGSKSRAAAGGDGADAPVAASPVTLAQLASTTGANLWANVDGGYVTACGTAAQVIAAKAALQTFVTNASDRYAEVPIQEWMIASVVGTKGANITQLQQETGAKLDVDRAKRLVLIQGPTKESIQQAKQVLQALISKLAAQRSVIPATAAGIGAIIGRGGATIRRLQVKLAGCEVLCERLHD